MAEFDDLLFTRPLQMTGTIRREVYDLISPENPANRQTGKIIVITGGGTGIGAAIARVWVQAGAEGVVIAGRRKDVLDKTVDELNKLSNGTTRVLGIATDVAKEKDVENLYDQVKKSFGRTADVVVANAGYLPPTMPLAEQDISVWWQGYEVNVKGLHNTSVYWIRSQPNAKEPEGTFINVSSALAGFALPGTSSYASTKLAGHRYVECLGADYPKIRSFTAVPGIVKTDILEQWLLPYAKDAVELTGALSLYLLSSRADFLISSVISVNWDIETLEAHKDEVAQGALKITWLRDMPGLSDNPKPIPWS